MDEHDLGPAAIECARRHLEAVNTGDKVSFEGTLFVPEAAKGKPFDTYWERLRSLVPIHVASFTVSGVQTEASTKWGFRHRSIYLDVLAETQGGNRSGSLVVWYREQDAEFAVASKLAWPEEGARP